jgi:hypothetical protein
MVVYKNKRKKLLIHAWNAISIGRITAITTGGFHAWRKGEVI